LAEWNVVFSVPFTFVKEATAMSEKVTRSRRNGKEIRLLEEEVAYVGVDTHKRSYQVAVWKARQGDIVKWTQAADPELLCERLRPIRERIGRVVYEAGPPNAQEPAKVALDA
jgi:hypothetical protein